MDYENRIVAFIDILGFKAMIDGTVNSHNRLEKIANIENAFNLIQRLLTEHYTGDQISEVKYSTFSDCIVFSFPSHQKDSLFYSLLPLIWLQAELVWNHNIFLRGAITIGEIYHTDKMVFGPAMVEAYKLESEFAKYPRIILDPKIKTTYDEWLTKLQEEGDQNKIYDLENELNHTYREGSTLLTKDDDDYYYIDYLNGIASEMDEPSNYSTFIEYVNNLIQPYLIPSANESLLRKYVWLHQKIKQLETD